MTYVQVNYNCNQNCIFCASDKTHDPEYIKIRPPTLPYELQNPNNRTLLHLNGGEPTIASDIFDIIEAGVKNFPYVSLSTNGQKFSDASFCKKIFQTGLDEIAIPFFSGEEKIHDFLTGTRKSFSTLEMALKNIFQLRKTNSMRVVFKILPISLAISTIPSLLSWWQEMRAIPDEVQISGLHISHRVKKNQNLIPEPRSLANELNILVKDLFALKIPFAIQELPLCLLNKKELELYLSVGVLRPNWRYENFVKVHANGSDDGWGAVPRFPVCETCEITQICGVFNPKRFDEVYKPLYEKTITPVIFSNDKN